MRAYDYRTYILSSSAALLIFAGGVAAADSNGFRGPDRNGVFPETGLLKEWPPEGPRLVWEYRDLGGGWCGPTVVDGTIYITGGHHGTGFLSALTLDGQVKWKSEYGPEYNRNWPGSKATPVVSDGRVYFASGKQVVYCFDAKTGKEVWSFDMDERYGSKNTGYGYNESPAVVGDLVIFSVRAVKSDTSPVVAVNKVTGETVWKAEPQKLSRGDNSLAAFEHNGRWMTVHELSRATVAYDAATGKKLWELPVKGHFGSPLYYKGHVVLPGKYDGLKIVRLSPDGERTTEVWDGARGVPTLYQVVAMDDRIYAFGVDLNMEWRCYDFATGTLIQKTLVGGPLKRTSGCGGNLCFASSGHVVAADGRVYMVCAGPVLALLKPTEDGFDVVGKFSPKIGKKFVYTNPVLAEGLMFLRSGGSLVAYDVRNYYAYRSWRGDGLGRYPESTVPAPWYEEMVDWTQDLPESGGSAPIAIRGKVFATCGAGTLACFEQRTGDVLWKREVKAGAAEAPGATPVTDGQRVFAAFRCGVVACYDNSGKEKWTRDIGSIPPAKVRMASPLLSGDTLIVQASELVAMDAGKGTVRWRRPLRNPRAVGSPVMASVAGTDVIVTSDGRAVRVSDGAVLTQSLPVTGLASPTVTEIKRQGICGYFCGTMADGKGTMITACILPTEETSDTELQELWRQEFPGQTAAFASPVVADGRLYTLTDTGRLRVFNVFEGNLLSDTSLPDAPVPGGEPELLMVGRRLYATFGDQPAHTVIMDVGKGNAPERVWNYAVKGGARSAFLDDCQFLCTGKRLYCVAGSAPEDPGTIAFRASEPADVPGGKDVPLTKVTSNAPILSWLCAGPIPGRDAETDFLRDLGGRTKAAPGDGAGFKYGDTNFVFRLASTNAVWSHDRFTDGLDALSVSVAMDIEKKDATSMFYTTVEIPATGYYRFHVLTPRGSWWHPESRWIARTWLNGVDVDGGDYVHMGKGRYRVMMQIATARIREGGKTWMAPRFERLTADEYAAAKQRYEKHLSRWKAYQESLKDTIVLGR